MDCPIHGPQDPDADPFDTAVSAMVTIYLMSREIAPDFADGRSLISIHTSLDDDPDIFTLRIGLGQAAHDVIDRERCEHEAAEGEPVPFHPMPMRLVDIFGPDAERVPEGWESVSGGGWESGTCAPPEHADLTDAIDPLGAAMRQRDAARGDTDGGK